MAWGDDEDDGYHEYMTLGPFRFPHERDRAANDLCREGGSGWHMHSSDICRNTGGYLCIMARWIKRKAEA